VGTPTVIHPLRLSRVATRKRWTPANTAPPSSPSSQLFPFSGMRIETSFPPLPLGSRSAASQSARMVPRDVPFLNEKGSFHYSATVYQVGSGSSRQNRVDSPVSRRFPNWSLEIRRAFHPMYHTLSHYYFRKMCVTMWNTRNSTFFVSICANVDNKG